MVNAFYQALFTKRTVVCKRCSHSRSGGLAGAVSRYELPGRENHTLWARKKSSN